MAAKRAFGTRRWIEICLALVGVWLIYRLFVAPLREREWQIRTATTDLGNRILAARKLKNEIQELEDKAAKANAEIRRSEAGLPTNPQIVWVPQRVRLHFGRFGFSQFATSVQSTEDEPALPGYQRLNWSVVVPLENVTKQIGNLLLAVAELEDAERTIRIRDIAIPRGVDESNQNMATVTFSTLERTD